jgi:hypothetical protein
MYHGVERRLRPYAVTSVRYPVRSAVLAAK